MRQLFLLILCSFVLTAASASKAIIDSLEQSLKQNTSLDTQRIQLLNQLGFEYWIVDPNQSETYGIQALELAKLLKYLPGEAFAHRIVGVAHWARGNYDPALEYLLKGLDKYQQLDDQLGLANVKMNIGMVYGDQLNYKLALQYLNEAIVLFQSLGQKGRIATTYTKIGSVYASQQKQDLAYEFFSKALKIHEEEAFQYGIAEVNNRLGILFMDQQDLDKGLSYLFRSLEAGEKLNDRHGMAGNYEKIGRIYWQKNDFRQAETYLEKGLNIARPLGIKTVLKELYIDLKNLEADRGNHRKALQYFDQYTAIKDSIFNEDKAVLIANLQTRAATAQQEQQLKIKQQEIVLLQQENRLANLWRLILISGFLLSLMIGIMIYRSQQRRILKNKEKLQTEKQLRQRQQTDAAVKLEQAHSQTDALQLILDQKNKELTSYTINFIRKNEMIQELKTTIRNIKKSSQPSTANQLNALERQLNATLRIDDDWAAFRQYFEQVHTNLLSNLKTRFPELSSNDLKLCALVRLNLSSKEMASMLGISPDSVKTARYRLRKKLPLEQESGLIDFLIKMEQ